MRQPTKEQQRMTLGGGGFWLAVAGLNGLIAVAAGAYGHHALGGHNSDFREIFLTGAQYHMWHTLALLGVAWTTEHFSGIAPALAGIAFSVGVFLFSGSLYVMGLTEDVPVRGAAPLGGMLLILGWTALIWTGFSMRRTQI
jgi:uncharacterized membrane protein YgdD (TMEM256/DUF423 family)